MNKRIVAACEPFYPALNRVFCLAWQNVIDAVLLLGNPTKVERANMMHAALRTELRLFCDQLEPVLQFIEEPEGQGLDCMLIDIGKNQKLAIRWGRFGDGRIRRNNTHRTRDVQGQGYLSFCDSAGDEVNETITASIGYDVADDFTEGGQPAWWLQRLVLIRERKRESEYIHDIRVYPRPEKEGDDSVMTSQSMSLRAKERTEIERLADGLRRKLG